MTRHVRSVRHLAWAGCSHDPLLDSGRCRRPPPLHGARGPCREGAPAAPGPESLTHCPVELVDSPMSGLPAPSQPACGPCPTVTSAPGCVRPTTPAHGRNCGTRLSAVTPCGPPRTSAPPGGPPFSQAGPSLSESHSPSQVSLCSGRPRLDGGHRFPMN